MAKESCTGKQNGGVESTGSKTDAVTEQYVRGGGTPEGEVCIFRIAKTLQNQHRISPDQADKGRTRSRVTG